MATDLRKTRGARRVRRRKGRRNLALALTGYLLVLAALSAGCQWTYFWLLEQPRLRLSAVEVNGLIRLERGEVLSAAGVSEGAPVVALDLRRLERRLGRLAWVASARAGLGWPLRLVINIKEKSPVALIRLDSLYYLAENGRPIKRLSPLEGTDYPVITGLSPSDLDNSRKLVCGRVIPLLARLSQEGGRGGGLEGKHQGLVGAISEVHVSAGGRLSLYTMDGLLIRLGERSDWETAIGEAGRVASDLRRRHLLADVAALDASCPARVFVRFSRDPKVLAATSKVRGA